jgi:hypothetical protein
MPLDLAFQTWKLLRNGETGKVLMTVPLKNALVIPQKTTYEIQDKNMFSSR